jgi:beta-glucosidase
VALVFAETKSGEGKDRDNLSLFDGWNGDEGSFSYDKLIEAVVEECAKSGTPVVVVMVSPGAVLTPWREKVQGAVAAFMPGQEYGNAISDILWGDVSPSARLPITFPDHENQWGFTEHQWPGVDYVSTYSEKLEVGYRYYDAHDRTPAYPFGHGLSYTSFSYSKLKATSSGVSFSVTNTGKRAGVEVPQLYLGFPATAGEPPKQLKGFKHVAVGAGETVAVTLPLNDRAFSIWDEQADDWAVQAGTFTANVGSSSRDVRLTGHFDVSGPGVSMLV